MFGLEKIGQESVEQAHVAVNDAIEKLDPLFRDVENRAGGILHGLLDRINGTEINLKIVIPPVPKATAANPPPKEHKY
jgi:hypothetical protein